MGLEGKASNEYWKGVKHFVPKEICFESRTKKPTDLLNSMLNYGYAILASEITKSILVMDLIHTAACFTLTWTIGQA